MQNRTSPRRLSTCILVVALSLSARLADAQNYQQPNQSGSQSTLQSAVQTTEHLTGIVLSTLDGKPVSRVLVVTPGDRMAAMTDFEGRFSFDFSRITPGDNAQPAQIFSSFPPGPTTGTATQATIPVQFILRKPGFLTGQVIVQLPAVQPATPGQTLELHITPAAAITGHLYGESGHDLPPNARVELRRRQSSQGLPAWVADNSAAINSRGEFRLPNLQPGDYKLLARGILPPDVQAAPDAGPTEAAPQSKTQPNSRSGFIPSYYANATNLDSAATIHVGSGETVPANLTLHTAPFYRVTIPTAGLPQRSGFSLHLEPESPGLPLVANGDQVTGYLPNGNYDVLLTAQARPMPVSNLPRNTAGMQYMMPGVQPNPPQIDYATVTLRVEGHPVQIDPPVAFHPAMEVPVTILRELAATSTTGSGDGSRGVFVTLESLLPGVPGAMRPPTSTPTDNITIPNVLPGLFHVAVSPGFPAYVSALTSGGTDLVREPLRVLPGVQPQPIQVTLRDDFGSLSVRIILPPGAEPESLLGCIPLDRPEDRPRFTSVETPQQLTTVPNLAPGRYLLVAFPDRFNENFFWQDPDTLRDLIPKGVVVTLTAGQQSHAEVPLLPGPPQ